MSFSREGVQTYLGERLSNYLKEKYDVEIEVRKLHVSFNGNVSLENVLIKDHHKDTLIYGDRVTTSLVNINNIVNKRIFFENTSVENAKVSNVIYKGEQRDNLAVFSKKLTPKKKSNKKVSLEFSKLKFNNLSYTFTNYNSTNKPLVNFHKISGIIPMMKIKGIDLFIKTQKLSFNDIYGVYYKNLKTEFTYGHDKMTFKNTKLVTDDSFLDLDLAFYYGDKGMKNFVENVKLKGAIFNSKLSYKDLNYFYADFDETVVLQKLKAVFTGTLNDLDIANFGVHYNNTQLQGRYSIKNSINNRQDISIRGNDVSVKANTKDIIKLVPKKYKKSIQQIQKYSEEETFVGYFTSSITSTFINGRVVTTMGKGNIKGNVSYKKNLKFDFQFSDMDVFPKKYDKSLILDRLKFDGTLVGEKGEGLRLETKGTAKYFKAFDIGIRKTKFNFSIHDSLYNSQISLNDEKIKGDIGFMISQGLNKTNSTAQLNFQRVDIPTLLNKKWTKNQLSFNGEISYLRNKNEISVQSKLDSISLSKENKIITLNPVYFDINSIKEYKELLLDSDDLLNFRFSGEYQFSDIVPMFHNSINRFLKTNNSEVSGANKIISYSATFHPKLFHLLSPNIQLEEDIKLKGTLQERNSAATLDASIPKFRYKDVQIDSLFVKMNNQNLNLNTYVNCAKIQSRNNTYEDFVLLGNRVKDTLNFKSDFKNKKQKNALSFSVLNKENSLKVKLKQFLITYNDLPWASDSIAKNELSYFFNEKKLEVEEFSIVNDNQKLSLSGGVGKEDYLKLNLENVLLDKILPKIDSVSLKGKLNGEFDFENINGIYKPKGNVTIDKFQLNNLNYGNLQAEIQADDKLSSTYNVSMALEDKNFKSIQAKGRLYIDKNIEKSTLDFKTQLNDFKLNSLSPLGKNVVSKIRGQASGNLQAKGTLKNINFYGNLSLKEAGVSIPYLNIDYNILGNPSIRLKKKKIFVENLSIQDTKYQTQGVLFGKVGFDMNNNWNLDLKISSDRLLAMDTSAESGGKYYGTGFIAGKASIRGNTSDLEINVGAKTLEGSKFVLPLSNVKAIEENKLLHFKELEEEKQEGIVEKEVQQKTKSGLTINLDLDITKGLEGTVVIDKTSGSSLMGRGDGKLLINIDKLFNISMYGDILIDSGVYDYKYGGIINKPFQVKQGGIISWNGDPYKADLSIEAEHTVKANPKILLEDITTNRKIDVNLLTKVSGEMFHSKQDFQIEIPNASSDIKSELDFKLNVDQDTKMRQFFSLLVSKSFFDENTTTSNSSVVNTTTEFISRAVTDIFNKEEDRIHVDLGYTSGETSEVENIEIDNQLDIGVETELNDRILINGKLGVPVGVSSQSTIVGEVKVEFLLNKDGSLKSTVFNRQNEVQYSEDEQGYTQGVGLNYQIDFDNFSGFLEKIGLKRRRKKKKKTKQDFNLTNDKLFLVLPEIL